MKRRPLNVLTDDAELDEKFCDFAMRANRIADSLRDGETTKVRAIDANRGLIAALESLCFLRLWRGDRFVEVTRIYGRPS